MKQFKFVFWKDKQGLDVWLAATVELCMVAQGDTIEDAKKNLEIQLGSQALVDKE